MSFQNSLAKVGTIALVIRQLLGLIVDSIRLAEDLIPESGRGREKLGMVRATIAAAIDKIEGLGVTFEEVWPRLEGIVAAWVAMLNAAGIFKSKGTLPAPANPQS